MNHCNKKKTRRRREYIKWNSTESFPSVRYRQRLRGNEESEMEDGFGVAGLNRRYADKL